MIAALIPVDEEKIVLISDLIKKKEY